MKKNFILFALMLFLPILAFAQPTITLSAPSVTYNGEDQAYNITTTYNPATSGRLTVNGIGSASSATAGTLSVTVTLNGQQVNEVVKAGEYTVNAVWDPLIGQNRTARATFTINPRDIKNANISVSPVVFQYSSTINEYEPVADVVDPLMGQLVKDEDYEFNCEDNEEVGTASAIITGIGNYAGTKTVYFSIISTSSTDVPEVDFSSAKITLNDVEYNGTATAANFASVTLQKQIQQQPVDVPQIYGTDYRVVGYVFGELTTTAGLDLSKIQAAPDRVGKWSVLIADANAANNFAKWGVKSFTVNPRPLKIDLLEIHKIYGDKDPILASDNNPDETPGVIGINKWASINWAPGDGPSNTLIEGIEFDRKTVGENAYDFDGNQIPYSYSLKNPDNLKAYKQIGDTKYYNYTVGVGQSSSLLIDKADLTVKCDVNTNVNVPDDWKWYNTADPVDANGSFAYKVVSGLKNNDVVQDTEASAIIKVTREPGEEATQDKNGAQLPDGQGGYKTGYAFIADAPNYNVTFQDKFNIRRQNPLDATSAIEVKYNQTQYVYTGAAQQPEPVVTYADYKTGTRERLTKGTDYTLAWSNNVNVGTATCTVTFTKNFQDVVDANKLKATFTITKANLKIQPTSISKTIGDEFPSQADLQAELQYTTLLGQDVKQDGTPNYRSNPAEKLLPPTVTIMETPKQGIYRLVIDAQAEAAKFANYNITTEEGLLTFGVKQLHIYAADKESYYGQPDVELTSYLKYDENDDPLSDTEIAKLDNVLKPAGTLIYSLSRAEGKDAGNYEISIEGPKEVSGYEVRYHSGNYKIKPRPVSLRANTQHKVYGEEDPELTIRVQDGLSDQLGVNGLQYDDTEDIFYCTLSIYGQNYVEPLYVVTREEGENVGSYKISVNQNNRVQWYWNRDAFKNYDVTFANDWNWIISGEAQGYLYISKRPMTVKVLDAEKFYGENDPTLQIQFEERSEGRGLVAWPTVVDREWSWTSMSYVDVIEDVDDQIDSRDWTISRDRNNGNRNGENAGYYELKIQHAVEGNPARPTNYNANYDIITDGGNGLLTIKKAILNVTAKDQGIDYGKDINKAFVYDVQGNKEYAYIWEIEKGKMVNATLPIETKQNPKTLNDQIEDLITLEATTTRVNTHAPETEPYKLVKSELCETNYVINFTQAYLSIAPLEEIPLDKMVEVFEGKEIALRQVLEDHQKATVGFRMPSNRSFKANTWYTLVLPFEIRVRDLSAALGYAVVDIFDEDNTSDDVKLKLFVNTLEPNKPFIVKVDEDITKTQMAKINFGGKKFLVPEFNYATEDPTISDKKGNSYTGTYEGKKPMATDEYFIAGDLGTFYTGSDQYAYSIKQTEAYLKKGAANSSASLRIYIEEPDGTTTIIEGVEAASEAAEAEAAEGWYTVTGVKLEAEPTTTGTYIFNGKKVFIQK